MILDCLSTELLCRLPRPKPGKLFMSLIHCDIPDAVDRPLSALTLILLNIANGSDRF